MKKIITFIFLCVLVTSTAFSKPLADCYPEQALGAICLGIEDLKNFISLTGEETETTKVSKEVSACLKNRFAIDIENEIEQIGYFFINKEGEKGFEGIAFIAGNFNPQNISSFVKKMIDSNKDSLKAGTTMINGKKVQSLITKDSRLIFYSKNMLLYCNNSSVSLIEEKKVTFSNAPQSIIDLMDRSPSFIYVGKKAKDFIPPNNTANIEGIDNLESLSGYYKNSCFYLEAGFSEEASAKSVFNYIENLKKDHYDSQSAEYEAAKTNIQHASIDILYENIEKIFSAAKSMDFINELNITRKNTSIVLAQPFDENNKAMFVVGGIGVLAAAAIPNFKKARESAREKACFSNIRVLQGAVEMYNLDNEIMMKSLDINTLVKGHYLKTAPKKPEIDCEYYSDGNLVEDGEVACRRHGRLPR